jgi:hypothetical protein
MQQLPALHNNCLLLVNYVLLPLPTHLALVWLAARLTVLQLLWVHLPSQLLVQASQEQAEAWQQQQQAAPASQQLQLVQQAGQSWGLLVGVALGQQLAGCVVAAAADLMIHMQQHAGRQSNNVMCESILLLIEILISFWF